MTQENIIEKFKRQVQAAERNGIEVNLVEVDIKEVIYSYEQLRMAFEMVADQLAPHVSRSVDEANLWSKTIRQVAGILPNNKK